MRLFLTFAFAAISVFCSFHGAAQNLAVTQPIPGQIATNQDTELAINLRQHFALEGVSGQIVQFHTRYGRINIELFQEDAPITSQNFLAYVDDGSYDNSMIHRSIPAFVIQGGGYKALNPPTAIASKGTIQNEFKRSNLRGTLAMAKIPTGPDTATNQWFINLDDNSENLDIQNGGFTVFGRVIGSGMAVVDLIEGLPRFNYSQFWGDAFTNVPLTEEDSGVLLDDLISVITAKRMEIHPQTDDTPSVIAFSVASSDDSLATASLSGSELSIAFVADSLAIATIKVTAIDSNGNALESAFTVKRATTTIQSADATVASTAGHYEIEIASNMPWDLSENPAWVSTFPTSGEDSATIDVQYAANPGLQSREAKIAIGGDGHGATHTLTQAGRPIGDSGISFDEWIRLHFDEEEIAAMEPSPWEADSDGDGIPNGVEQALGLDPAEADANPFLFVGRNRGASPVLELSPYHPDILVMLEYSEDWLNWSAPNEANGSVVDGVLRIPLSQAAGITRFYRVASLALRETAP